MKRFFFPTLLLLAAAACAPKTNVPAEVPIRTYNAPKATGAITIDGILDEADWQNAPLSDAFADIRGVDFEPKPIKQTHMKMLWDSENLYIAGIIEEDNVTASLTEHDAIIYHDNDWEVFIDPDQDGRFYFEIELNALNTVMDLLMDKPYSKGGTFIMTWDFPGLKTAVKVQGTLNRSNDTDKGWSVEIMIPFDGLKRGGDDPRKNKEWKANFSRVEWLTKPEENWVWSPTGIVDIHHPYKWGTIRFVE